MKLLNNKFLQIVFAFGPLVLIILALLYFFNFIFGTTMNIENMDESHQHPMSFFSNFAGFIILAFSINILSLLSLVFYILHAVKNPLIKDDIMRVVWILIIVLISIIGFFIYWLVEIKLKNPKPVITE